MIELRSFEHVEVGDTIVRLIAETIPMRLTVTAVDATLIYTGRDGVEGWTFERATGFEYDPELSWGSRYGRTGSRITAVEKGAPS